MGLLNHLIEMEDYNEVDIYTKFDSALCDLKSISAELLESANNLEELF